MSYSESFVASLNCVRDSFVVVDSNECIMLGLGLLLLFLLLLVSGQNAVGFNLRRLPCCTSCLSIERIAEVSSSELQSSSSEE